MDSEMTVKVGISVLSEFVQQALIMPYNAAFSMQKQLYHGNQFSTA